MPNRWMRVVASGAIALAAVVTPLPLRGQEGSAGATLRGTVIEHETDRPMEGAAVTLTILADSVASPITGLSGADGSFEFQDVAPGLYELSAELLGYRTLVDTLRFWSASEVEITVPLSVAPVPLAPLVVVVQRPRSRTDPTGFQWRSRRLTGTFLTREDVERWGTFYFTDLLRTVGGIRVTRSSWYGRGVRMRGGCVPDLWIDGARLGPTDDIDAYVRTEDVESVEIYRGPQVPAEFARNACGALIVWTRRGEPSAGDRSLLRQVMVAGSFVLLVLILGR